jgi:hypothetical protein
MSFLFGAPQLGLEGAHQMKWLAPTGLAERHGGERGD